MIPPLDRAWDDADIAQAIHHVAREGWSGGAASLLARVTGWSEEDAALELEQEDPTERVCAFLSLLAVHCHPDAPLMRVTPKLIAELTGWHHVRVERALVEAVSRGRRALFRMVPAEGRPA